MVQYLENWASSINQIVKSFLAIAIIMQTGCKKFIEVDAPNTNINGVNVYESDATAAAVLTDIYANLSAGNSSIYSSSLSSLSWYAALAADELNLHFNSNTFPLYYRNEITSVSSHNYWNTIYPAIFTANAAISGLTSSHSLTTEVRDQLLGEARFMRAFFYFYLVNMYGEVPLVLDTDYKESVQMTRTSKTEIYQQIIADLKEAQGLLSEKYLKADAFTAYTAGAQERVRPTKWAATALLARVYLYINDWANAEIESSRVISNVGLFNLISDINQVFKKNQKESIWELQPVGTGANSNTGDGKLFVLPTSGPSLNNNPISLSAALISSFESNDRRRFSRTWIDSIIKSDVTYYFAYKYKIGNVNTTNSENIIVFRLAEQYLIRAEARTQRNDIEGAKSDLNAIRQRADIALTTANDKASLLNAILQERRLELFTEWGHRWFDLKRTNTIDATMDSIALLKGGTWNSYKMLWPIPQTDIDRNSNLIQNTGY